MLAQIIGVFDVPSAAVMIAFFGASAACISVLLGRKRKADFQIEARRAEWDHQEKMGTIARDGDIARAKLQQNLITSHKSEDN